MADSTRRISTQIGSDGRWFAKTHASPVGNQVRACVMAPASRVVPIVFVPGIMGSNLKAGLRVEHSSRAGTRVVAAGARIWNVDSATSLSGWLGKSPAYRQLVLNKDVVAVDDRGKLAPSSIPVALAFKRGWGTVSWAFYGGFLDWLQAQLLDVHCAAGAPSATFSQLMRLIGTIPPGAPSGSTALKDADLRPLARLQFPVHAVGYNWLQSNLHSGDFLAERIRKDIIPSYHGIHGQHCEQVILVTHSMGGLVARAAAVHAKASDLILGVIHGVMPTDGAAAFYKRLAAGFGSEGGGLMGGVQSLVLGRTARETTPVIAYNPGPLELAPNKRYNGGKPWLFIKSADGKRVLKALPEKGDPYSEIYAPTDVAWRAVTPEWLNPAGLKAREEPEIQYLRTLGIAACCHTVIGGKSHSQTYAHYSADKTQMSWGSLSWRAECGEPYSRLAASGQVSMTSSRWLADHTRTPESPDAWRLQELPSTSVRFARDGIRLVRMTITTCVDAGDATVPATASAAQVASHEGCQLACSHDPGYEHSASYDAQVVRNTVLDAVIRLARQVISDR